MKWGDSKRDSDPILAVWPEYRAWDGVWHMIEFAEGEPHEPQWRDRRIPAGDHVKADVYLDEQSATLAATALNTHLAATLDSRNVEEVVKTSLRLKARKALQAKTRLATEEKLMLQEAMARHRNTLRPSEVELYLPLPSEPYRAQLYQQLTEMPYLDVVLIGRLYQATLLFRDKDNRWSKPFRAGKAGAQKAQRAKIANGFGMNATLHWGKTKARIREILLPRANQLLKLASVQRLLDEARARGERILVVGSVVFWYEEDDSIGWQVKTVAPTEDADGTSTWEEGSIVSKNHGRIVVLPFVKEDGERVSGHTRNAPGDGPAKPRHPDHFVTVPFKRLNDDLMIGLYGELPYE
ncbi:MAG: hypothetical protein P4M09_18070 [Devosia sp.]|nr:hypothetical protein [Devosia sp.]